MFMEIHDNEEANGKYGHRAVVARLCQSRQRALVQGIKEKPKGDLSANEASDYAKHRIFKKSKD